MKLSRFLFRLELIAGLPPALYLLLIGLVFLVGLISALPKTYEKGGPALGDLIKMLGWLAVVVAEGTCGIYAVLKARYPEGLSDRSSLISCGMLGFAGLFAEAAFLFGIFCIGGMPIRMDRPTGFILWALVGPIAVGTDEVYRILNQPLVRTCNRLSDTQA